MFYLFCICFIFCIRVGPVRLVDNTINELIHRQNYTYISEMLTSANIFTKMCPKYLEESWRVGAAHLHELVPRIPDTTEVFVQVF